MQASDQLFQNYDYRFKRVKILIFFIPILMFLRATHVPVGEDQLQHLQLAHQLAKTFNSKYGITFPQCHSIVVNDKGASRIRSLRDPTKKMSKSDADVKSTIFLTDLPDQILEKIKKAVTDCTGKVTFDMETRPGVSNLINIHSLAIEKSIEDICRDCANRNIDTGAYKLEVAEALINLIEPTRTKILEYLKHPDYIEKILRQGADKASSVASVTLAEVKSKIGFCNIFKTRA